MRPDLTWRLQIEARCGENVSLCYQCAKCTNGCPVAPETDYKPNQIMRMAQLGMRDAVLRSRTIWICASCQTCSARCPNDIQVARVMDALRRMSCEAGIEPAEKNVAAFHDAFLASVRRHGRAFELGLMGRYQAATRDPLSHARLGLELMRRGKIRFLPARIRARKRVREYFRQTRKG